MARRTPRLKRPDTLLPDTTLFRSAAGEERLPTINARTRGGLTGRDAQPARRRMLRADRIIEIIAPVRREHIGRPEAAARRTVVVDPRDVALTQQRSVVPTRSEEHTSELQSLILHSYAVLCLQ